MKKSIFILVLIAFITYLVSYSNGKIESAENKTTEILI